MKHFLLFFLGAILLSSFNACAQDDPILEELENENVLRVVEVEKSNRHLAFTSITGSEDRSKLVLVYREGSAHASFDGELIQVESYDKGQTWENRRVIYRTDGSDARDPQFFLRSDGHLLCRFFERESESESTVKCLHSDNLGNAYTSLSSFPFPAEEKFAAARGNMVEIDGAIYTVCYNRWAQSWWVRSEDGGNTWKIISGIDDALGTPDSPFLRINEASLGYEDGKLYMVARTQGNDTYMQLGISSDLGRNWTWKTIPIKGQAPSMTPYDGGFILTYRLVNVVNESYEFQVAYLKDGEIYGTPVSLFHSRTMDIGYGDALTLPNSFLVCCYQPNKIVCYEISYDIFNQ